MSPRQFHIGSLCLWWLLWAVTTWFALSPSADGVDTAVFGWDKLDHLLAFGSLAFWMCPAWPGASPVRVIAVLLAYGALIEVVQTQIPGRFGSAADWFADAVGIGCGLALWTVTRSVWHRFKG